MDPKGGGEGAAFWRKGLALKRKQNPHPSDFSRILELEGIKTNLVTVRAQATALGHWRQQTR